MRGKLDKHQVTALGPRIYKMGNWDHSARTTVMSESPLYTYEDRYVQIELETTSIF